MRILLLFILALSLNAKTMIASYYAKYGIFGTIAEANAIYEANETNYKIFTESKALGLAATLSKHMVQTYSSIGVIKDNILIPNAYISTRKKGDDFYKRIYLFDHKNKKIIRLKYKNGKLEANETMPYYTPDDVLSLYFNLPNYLKKLPKKEIYTFYALGGRKSDGKVDVTFPKGRELEKVKDTFDNAKGVYIKANLYNKVFAGDKGILYLVIDPKNWVTLKGMVKNVLKIGDLKGGLKDFKLIP
ncbi:hypothetical protein NAMH_0058 [Nautilia profundicola AmH]|uniref:DUF3108 domain-containing protein n=1 Tax=Nautilia profundicola (strain ATCC BAA-1463 / DSM 18972 / AmH) TaxID=598659 RepID=B9L793_NAUPA|nr:hypothetical protein [Nautilia profundicola]ACM93545.1 hypothetical protein NAMH_0058 [Nautilia profundicola AmH]